VARRSRAAGANVVAANLTDVTAYVGLGSNLGNSVATVRAAMSELRSTPGITGVVCSSLYRTEPIGLADQPDFINAVCRLQTALGVDDLLARLMEIERNHGRERSGIANEPRTLDLDLLLYGTATITTDTLVLPHPRLHERAFVLYPLFEIAPNLAIPGLGIVARLRHACGNQTVVRLESDPAE
jgi:2-amino-4-hydroxy-6-hydroxymethyldihydropteridine diphosphokinase